jgi:hypothetical protein
MTGWKMTNVKNTAAVADLYYPTPMPSLRRSPPALEGIEDILGDLDRRANGEAFGR